jgi:8-oxo-dGTP diphosphatase
MTDIHKIGMLIVREGRMLLCRKRESQFWILPGGRIEDGESPEECLRRELHEELGEVETVGLCLLGSYSDQAAGEVNRTVQVDLYVGELRGIPVPHSEIEELRWFANGDDESTLAPSIRKHILPDLIRRGMLQ